MKLDKYIKLTDGDVEFLHGLNDEDYNLDDWTREDLLSELKALSYKMVVVKPAGKED